MKTGLGRDASGNRKIRDAYYRSPDLVEPYLQVCGIITKSTTRDQDGGGRITNLLFQRRNDRPLGKKTSAKKIKKNCEEYSHSHLPTLTSLLLVNFIPPYLNCNHTQRPLQVEVTPQSTSVS